MALIYLQQQAISGRLGCSVFFYKHNIGYFRIISIEANLLVFQEVRLSGFLFMPVQLINTVLPP